MLSKEEIRCLLKDAAFDRDEYWVTSGAAMVLYGIKELTPDIDLGCTSPMADRLEREGYDVEVLQDGSRRIVFSAAIELFENWVGHSIGGVAGRLNGRNDPNERKARPGKGSGRCPHD